MLLQNNVCVYNRNNTNNNNTTSVSEPSATEGQNKMPGYTSSDIEGRPRLNVFSQPHTVAKHEGKAMNYYRVWIHACNIALFVGVVGFVFVSGKIVVFDPRRTLIPGLSLYEPSLVYAYCALIVQSGLLQSLGFLGAQRLNEKFLNLYWFLLLFLLFGDTFVGIFWIFRFDKIYNELKPALKLKLQTEYGVNDEFTRLWDRIQYEYHCCGVEGPQDFNEINLSRKNSKRKESHRNLMTDYEFTENERNQILIDKVAQNINSQLENFSKTYSPDTTTSDENLTDDTKNPETLLNSFLSTFVTMSSWTDEATTPKYVYDVPESCCRVLSEEIPDESHKEEYEQPQNRPTAVRQRLEKKKSRNQENKISKRSITNAYTPFISVPSDTPLRDKNCIGSKNCKSSTKRHVMDSKIMKFRNNHVRHDSLYRNTHSTGSSNTESLTRKSKEPKYSTGNHKIMDTCARINGYSKGTVYGKEETLHYTVGCEVRLKQWLIDAAHVLGVFGYCVIAFLKFCFLGILRYELKEMIQKIRMMEGNLQPPVLLLNQENSAQIQQATTILNQCNHVENSMTMITITTNAIEGEGKRENSSRMRENTTGNTVLLVQPQDSNQSSPLHEIKTIQMTQQNHRLFNSILGQDTGNDSDTNSNCALLLDGDDPSPKKKHTRMSSNGNNNYEDLEMQELFATHNARI